MKVKEEVEKWGCSVCEERIRDKKNWKRDNGHDETGNNMKYMEKIIAITPCTELDLSGVISECLKEGCNSKSWNE